MKFTQLKIHVIFRTSPPKVNATLTILQTVKMFFFFEEQRAPRERAPSSELRLEGKGVKRTRETVVPFAKLKKKFQARKVENVLLRHIHVDEMKKELSY